MTRFTGRQQPRGLRPRLHPDDAGRVPRPGGAAAQQDLGPGHHPLQHGVRRHEDGDRRTTWRGDGGEHEQFRDADDQGGPRIPDEEHDRRQRLRRGIGDRAIRARSRCCCRAIRSQFENVRFIGNIGTLYVKSSSELIKARSYFRDCYIEGDQDFIVGRGTAVFDHCEIKVPGRAEADGRQHRLSEHAGVQRLRVPVRQLQRSPRRRARAARRSARQWVEQGDTVGDARHGGRER